MDAGAYQEITEPSVYVKFMLDDGNHACLDYYTVDAACQYCTCCEQRTLPMLKLK